MDTFEPNGQGSPPHLLRLTTDFETLSRIQAAGVVVREGDPPAPGEVRGFYTERPGAAGHTDDELKGTARDA